MTSLDSLISCVNRLRPASADNIAQAQQLMQAEISRLKLNPAVARMIGAEMKSLCATSDQAAFLAETGMHSALGFFGELMQRLIQPVFPPVRDLTKLRDALNLVFHKPEDYVWVNGIADAQWHEFSCLVGLDQLAQESTAYSTSMDHALQMLSYRLAGAALDRELLACNPEMEGNESCFLQQQRLLKTPLDMASVLALQEKLDECRLQLRNARDRAHEIGISVRLTYLLFRMNQIIERMKELLVLCNEAVSPAQTIQFFKVLLAGEQMRNNTGEFVGINISLLSRNITDHASRHGEHYIAENRAQWWHMAKSAAGGGVVIACMALVKIQLSLLHLPSLTEGILFGLNYGLGFALIHMLGFSVATKQPAMTASSIAATVEESKPQDLNRLVELARNTMRTQFAAVLGNVGLAMPVAALIALGWQFIFGAAVAPDKKLIGMLQATHPWQSAALFYAAIAAVGLFLSGLVSGFFDNQARYSQIALRLEAAPFMQWLGESKRRAFANYMDEHYGALLGNLFFGMYLGLVGTFGIITGLPLDIAHVAFASANLSTAITVLDSSQSSTLWPMAAFGVVLIAVINLAVSFSLALWVALKARRMGWNQMAQLGALVARQFVRRPLSFFRPPH